MAIRRKKEISIPRVIKYGDVEFNQRWFRPTRERVKGLLLDLKDLPEYSKYKFAISGSFLSVLVNKNREPVWDLDFIIVGDRDLPYESIREMLWSVVNIGCGKYKMHMDTYFMYLDDYIKQGTSSICSPSNEVINQYKKNSEIKLRSITKKSLTSWGTMHVNGEKSPHAKVKGEIYPGLWSCEKYLPTPKHVKRINSGHFFGDEMLAEEYLSQY